MLKRSSGRVCTIGCFKFTFLFLRRAELHGTKSQRHTLVFRIHPTCITCRRKTLLNVFRKSHKQKKRPRHFNLKVCKPFFWGGRARLHQRLDVPQILHPPSFVWHPPAAALPFQNFGCQNKPAVAVCCLHLYCWRVGCIFSCFSCRASCSCIIFLGRLQPTAGWRRLAAGRHKLHGRASTSTSARGSSAPSRSSAATRNNSSNDTFF